MIGEGEFKTKPTQNALNALRLTGNHADIVILRSENPIAENNIRKIAYFANLNSNRVINLPNESNTFLVPERLHSLGLLKTIENVIFKSLNFINLKLKNLSLLLLLN
jgi:CTP synthase